MANTVTGGYDVVVALTESELNRLVVGALLEGQFPRGVPLELDRDVDLGGFLGRHRLHARVQLPEVSFTPRRDELRLFATLDNLVLYGGPTGESVDLIKDRRGTLEAFARLGYRPDGSLGILADTVEAELRIDGFTDPITLPTGALSSVLANANLPLSAGKCPVAPAVVPAADREPSLAAAMSVTCADFELPPSPAGATPSPLLLELKLTSASTAAGTNGPEPLDASWRGADGMAFAIANSYLLSEQLPPALIAGLVKARIEAQVHRDPAVRDEDRERVIRDRILTGRDAMARQHFRVRPLEVIREFPLHADLPYDSSADAATRDNVWIRSIALSVPPGSDAVLIDLGIFGNTPDYELSGNVVLEAHMRAAGGRLVPEISVKERSLSVLPRDANSWLAGAAVVGLVIDAALGAVIGAVAGGLLGGPEGALAGTLIGAAAGAAVGVSAFLVAVWLVSLYAGQRASLSAPAPSSGDDGDGLLPAVIRRAALYDLVMAGSATPVERDQIAFSGYTRAADAEWKLNLDGESHEMPPHADAPILRDAFTGVTDERADVVFGPDGLTARPGAALHDFGVLPLFEALALRQIDLRGAAHEAGTIDARAALMAATDFSALIAADIAPSRLARVDPELRVHAVGLRTRSGRPALLLLWPAQTSGLRCHYRRYRQGVSGVKLQTQVESRNTLTSSTLDTIEIPASLPGAVGRSWVDVPVRVGWKSYSFANRGRIRALKTLIRQPLTHTWTVTTAAGATVLARGAARVIDVGGSPVSFEVVGFLGEGVDFRPQGGTSGSFRIDVVVTEDLRAPRSFSAGAGADVSYTGSGAELVGLDRVTRLLEIGARELGSRDKLRGPPSPATPRDAGEAGGVLLQRVVAALRSLDEETFHRPATTRFLTGVARVLAGLPAPPPPAPPEEDPPAKKDT